MKKLLVVFALPCVLLCATDQTASADKPAPAVKSKASKTPAKPAVAKPAPVPAIPAGAIEVEPFLYRFQDADGKKWLYRQTPFGVVKMDDKPPAAAAVTEDSNPVSVKVEGETVKFEKKTPFGVQSWTRKKAELSEDEKVMVQNSLNGGASPENAAGKTPTGSPNREKQ